MRVLKMDFWLLLVGVVGGLPRLQVPEVEADDFEHQEGPANSSHSGSCEIR